MVFFLRAACASLLQLIAFGHALKSKDPRLNWSPEKDFLVHDSLMDSLPDTKDIESKMLAAAQREAEQSASAKTNAHNMVNAAAKKAADVQKAAKANVQKIVSGAKKTMDKSMNNTKASIKTATDKQATALAEAKTSILAAMKALKIASSNEELITANRKAQTVCEAAVVSANKSMKQTELMLTGAQKEANDVRLAAQRASDDLEKAAAKTKQDLENLASQVAEVGSTVANKMQAKADGNSIAAQTSQTADDIKAMASKFVDETHAEAVSTRSSGEDVANSILEKASDAKTHGDNTATHLADMATAATKSFSNAKGSWVRTGTVAVGALKKAASPVEKVELPENSAATVQGTPQPSLQRGDGSFMMSLIAFTIVLFTVVAATIAKVTCFSKS